MDRPIVYDGALPQVTDILNGGKFTMVGQAFLNQALLGSSAAVAGLACTPTSPAASLQVNVATGSIYQLDPTDASAYGDLGTDNNVILKQGILHSPATLTITPPATSGFSQVYLVQAILNDVDTGSTALSYYNSANPASPYSGPANSGISQFTIRSCQCAIALKVGVAATTGTQVAPSPDAGYVGLYTITVANGATQITSGNITQLASAPFFPTLPQVPAQVQQGAYVYAGQDTGTANNYVITFAAGQPIPTAYVAGMGVKFKALNACSGASVINVNGLGNVNIRRASGVAVATADIVSGQMVELTYDGTNFQMQNYMGAGAGTNTTTAVSIPYVADSGTQNALVGTYSPAITSGQQVAGLALEIKLANTITGACTINVNGLGVKNVLTGDLVNPPNNVYVAGEVLLLVYDGTQYQIANTSSLTYRKPSANTTIYVNTALGNDANDGTSNTSGHALATIQAGVNKAYGYAPSGFTITVVVEPGTYNENVVTPTYSGPSIIIDGLVASSVSVYGGNGHCFIIQGPNAVTIKNLTASNNGAYPNICFGAIGSGASLTTNNCISGTTNSVFYASSGASVSPLNHTFSGSCAACYSAIGNGSVSIQSSITHTFSTAISVSFATISAQSGGSVGYANVNPVTYVNPSFVSGPKYSATINGTITLTGLGGSFIPGSAAGSTSLGGQIST